MSEIPMVEVLRVRAMPGNRLWLRFTDGCEGVWDMSGLLSRQGEMLEPLKKTDFFERVFVEMGVPTWPNGFDLDAIALHDAMKRAGLLTSTRAA